jgi:hypothetical protein
VPVLARAQTSRLVDSALVASYQGERPRREIPDYALDMHTKAGRALGRGAAHFYEEGAVIAPTGPVEDLYRERARAREAERR